MSEKPSIPDRIDAFAKKLMGVKPRRDPRKEEKPIFAAFQDRVMASVLDMAVIYLLLQDVFRYVSIKVFAFADIAKVQAARDAAPVDVTMIQTVRYYVDASFETGLAQLWLINSFIQSLIVGVILVIMWKEFHTTLGKYLIGLEMAGKGGEGQPTLKQYIARYAGFYLSMPLMMIGFVALGFDRNKRAWHDRLAGTTVIYAKRGSIFRQVWDWIRGKKS